MLGRPWVQVYRQSPVTPGRNSHISFVNVTSDPEVGHSSCAMPGSTVITCSASDWVHLFKFQAFSTRRWFSDPEVVLSWSSVEWRSEHSRCLSCLYDHLEISTRFQRAPQSFFSPRWLTAVSHRGETLWCSVTLIRCIRVRRPGQTRRRLNFRQNHNHHNHNHNHKHHNRKRNNQALKNQSCPARVFDDFQGSNFSRRPS